MSEEINNPKSVVLERGGLCYVMGWFFVIVNVVLQKDGRIVLECICDNANNRYFWELSECDDIWDRATVSKWKKSPIDRPIPYDVIREVLVGEEDDRFSDYREKK